MAVPASQPAFVEEFDGRQINDKQWSYATERNRAGWFNNELQNYLPRAGRMRGWSVALW